jgi:uncharacterized RmlC-like cupin family protein
VTLRIASFDEDIRSEWKDARIIRPLELVSHAIESAGVARLPAITHELVGSDHLWMGMTILEPGGAIGPHHHGDRETGVYLVAGRLRLRWGRRLQSTAELEVGDLVFLPPYLPHEEVNPDPDESAVWLVVWNESQAFVPLAAGANGGYGEEPTAG